MSPWKRQRPERFRGLATNRDKIQPQKGTKSTKNIIEGGKRDVIEVGERGVVEGEKRGVVEVGERDYLEAGL